MHTHTHIYIYIYINIHRASLKAAKESSCNVGDLGSILGLERSPGEGNGYPLHCSGLESDMTE